MITWFNKYIFNEEANKITEILPGKLYLSNWRGAYSCISMNIRYVVNMTPYIPNFHSRSGTVTYLSLPLPDVPEANISQHFEQATSFIDEIAKDEPVLVHCVVGASHSVSVVLAYLMKKNNWDVQTALSHLTPDYEVYFEGLYL
jgi:protein-tyrosine phosphatase